MKKLHVCNNFRHTVKERPALANMHPLASLVGRVKNF